MKVRKDFGKNQEKLFYQFGPFRLDVRERMLERHGEEVPLTPKVFEILLVLVQNSGRILTKDEMMSLVWPDTMVEESNLSRNVSTLRKALGDGPNEHHYIETIPWRGYRFVASVREMSDKSAAIDSLAVLPFLYLRGRYFWNKLTLDGVRKGIEHFQQAIEKDPGYAAAYAGLLDCYTYLNSPAEARRAAIKALELDPALGEAHASLGFFRFLYDWDWPEAEREFMRAIELNPNYPEAHHWYAIFLANMGRHREAIREAKHARELDPFSLLMSQTAGNVLCLARDYDRAIDELKKTLDMDSNFAAAHGTLGLVYAQKGMCEEAIAEFRKVIALVGGSAPIEASVKALVGYAYALSGDRSQAIKLIDEISDPSQPVPPPYSIAGIYAALGETDRAFEWLNRAYHGRSFQLVGLKVDPILDNLRSDPRFKDLLDRIGLAL